jgi:hypothetical protein
MMWARLDGALSSALSEDTPELEQEGEKTAWPASRLGLSPAPGLVNGTNQIVADIHTRTGVTDIMSTIRTFAIRIDDSAFGSPR